MRTELNLAVIRTLIEGRCANPRSILGPHPYKSDSRQTLVRAWLPHCVQASAVSASGQVLAPLRKVHPAGLYEGIIPASFLLLDRKKDKASYYCLRVTDQQGRTMTTADPYEFPSQLSDYDLYLLGEGQHWQSYNKLGAHACEINGVQGVNFVVWAPNARAVSVVGDFNHWDNRIHPLQKVGVTGYWELFIPGIGNGTLYKFSVNQNGNWVEKFDPYAFGSECPPKNASKVCQLNDYQWRDQDWIRERSQWDWLHKPISIYEAHLGSFMKPDDSANPEKRVWLTYREIAEKLIPHVKNLGYTHIEVLPLGEHPLTISWGYQIVGYYCPTARYGSPEDLMYLIDQCHQNGIGVIMDWVPAHFPKDSYGLARFDGTALYEHADPRQGEHKDWGTYIFNYSRYEVRNFLVSNALFWVDKFHIDGLRVDAVASMLYLDYSRKPGEWVPNEFGGRENLAAVEFLKLMNEQMGIQFPGVLTIAEESTAWPGVSRPTYVGGLGFSLKWNMGWMNDTLSYFKKDPVYRKFHQNNLTFSLMYAFSENFVLPISHDEVVHCKGSLINQMAGDLWQKYANLRLLFSYMWTHPGKKLLFMGAELGQWSEWNVDSQLEWNLLQYDSPQGLIRVLSDLNRLYVSEPALHEYDFDWKGFEWIDCNNADASVLSYIRKAKDPKDYLVCVANFTPCVRDDFWVGVPETITYETIFNSDSNYYKGSNVGQSFIQAQQIECQGKPACIRIQLPPLGMLILKPKRESILEKAAVAHAENKAEITIEKKQELKPELKASAVIERVGMSSKQRREPTA